MTAEEEPAQGEEKKPQGAGVPEVMPPAGRMSRPGAANTDRMLGHILAQQTDSFTGPIPSPTMLEGYAKVDNTFPERLIAAWEGETKHRHEMDRREMCIQEGALNHAKDMDRREMDLRHSGQLHSTLLVVMLLALGGFLAYYDKTAVAITIFSSTIVALSIIYVLRKFPDRRKAAAPEEPERGDNDKADPGQPG